MKKLISVIILLLFTGCSYYNYGVNKDDPQLIYREKYRYEEKDQYRFHSTICDTPYIEITHLSHPHRNKSVFHSTIRVLSYINDENMVIKSVFLEHRDTGNRLIKPAHIEWPNLPIAAPSEMIPHFIKTYNKTVLPETIIEIIRIELVIDGKPKVLEYRFTLEYKKNYTTWDVMMSV